MTERGEKIRDAFFKKYGVYHPSQLPEVKAKIKKKRENGAYDNVVAKMKNTLKEKYGNENYVNVEKVKRTKLEKYGNETYNNRDKMKRTNNEKYGMNVSPNTLKRIQERSSNGDIGVKSARFKKYLEDNNVTNVSQLPRIKEKKRQDQINHMIANIFDGGRLNNVVLPIFQREEYTGCDYNKMYKFKCCKCNNEFEDNLYSGNIPRCLNCYPHNRFSSSTETEILEFLHSYNIETKHHDRTILNGYEIDIYIPSLNIAIECDGIYWHSEIAGGKNKQYHLNKTLQCNKQNIQLLHIWDWEWRCKKSIIKSILINKIGKSAKVYAKKCIIKELANEDKINFLETNHIQGDDISSIRLGLYYNNELVSIMTFVKARYDKKYQYELSRYCNLLNTNVIGGSSKLFAYFIKNYNVDSVVTYSDKRLFTGKVYEHLAMRKLEDTPCSYHYFHKNNCVPLNRTSFQKHKLSKILEKYDADLSEWQNMQVNGYDRIWDCGHFKFEWIRM